MRLLREWYTSLGHWRGVSIGVLLADMCSLISHLIRHIPALSHVPTVSNTFHSPDLHFWLDTLSAVRYAPPPPPPSDSARCPVPPLAAPASTRSNGFNYPEQSEVDKYYPQYYHKTDREGRPIYIEQLGKLDYNKLYALTTQERQLKHLVSEYEKFFRDRLPACSKHMGTLVETSCTILDLHNAGISIFYKGEWGG